MPLDLDDKSTLVQVMAWCHQATSHYLSQCWPLSMSPNGVTRPQWVNIPTFFMPYWLKFSFYSFFSLIYWNTLNHRSPLCYIAYLNLYISYPNFWPSTLIITPIQQSCCGVCWFHSVCLSVRPSVRPPVPHPVSAMQHLQFWLDPFDICASNQATSTDVLLVTFLAQLKSWIFSIFFKFAALTLSCFDLGSDVNH